nr:hypothetical protein [Chlamydiota bacterium]
NKPASKQPRKNIKLGGDVWKRIGEILDPEKTKKSDKLDSPRVYKHSRAEGEREEKLARNEAERTRLQKELANADEGDEAAIQRQLDDLQGKKCPDLPDELSDVPPKVLSRDEKARVKALEAKIKVENKDIKKIEGNTSLDRTESNQWIGKCRDRIADWEHQIGDIKAPKGEEEEF